MAKSNLAGLQERYYYEVIEFYRIVNGWTRMEFIEELASLSEQMQSMILEDFKTVDTNTTEEAKMRSLVIKDFELTDNMISRGLFDMG